MLDTVNARWVAGYRAQLPDGTQLVPGETVAAVPAGEAAESANWQPEQDPAPAPKRTAPDPKDGH